MPCPAPPHGTNHMKPIDRIFAFEQACYRYRTNLPCREDMIQCGIDATLDGVASPNVVLLAGATDGDDDKALAGFFLKAAAEVGCDLPRDTDSADAWIARHSVKCLMAGLELPDFDIEKQVERNLLLCLIELRKAAGDDAALSRFTALFGRYVERLIDDFGPWLDELCDAAAPSGKMIDPVAATATARIAGLIAGFAYGAMEQAHCDESLSIAADLIGHNHA